MFMGCCFSSRLKTENPPHNGLDSKVGRTEGEILQSNNLKCFTFNELKTATRSFRPHIPASEASYDSVYKGWINEHTLAPTKPDTGFVIAVKLLEKEGYQNHTEWLSEINYLGQLYHPNLVKLIGYCLEDDYRMLVYEFMAKGSLNNHLFTRSSYFQPLSWKIRMKIALDAAKGLAFLHSDEVEVIYRDFKTSNILIDYNYNAKLSNFGLAKDEQEEDQTLLTSPRLRGTLGYTAPEAEYIATGDLTKKSDIYSFGVVLLEILSGKRAVDKNRAFGEQKLVEWAKPLLISKHKISHVMDAGIEGQYSLHESLKVARIVIQCLSVEPKFRPNIDEVVRSLEQLQDSKAQAGVVI